MANLESNLSSNEVQRIHNKRTAVKGRFYIDEDKVRYLGLEDGHLQRIPTIKGDVTVDLEASVVSTVGGKTAIEISNTVEQTIINTAAIATKINKCESIALSIALG